MKKQKAFAWSKYYEERREAWYSNNRYFNLLETIRNEGLWSETIPTHIQNEMKTLYKELKKEIECPICLEKLNPEKMKFAQCGHKYCPTCYSKIDKCAICRKKIFKKT
jgi:hypothetical protein